ncbi:MAG TPA: hypothetical protein VFR21_31070, partial [Bradyrhizobium sp.]|nr:hypothetical protein [Bradyrhizobium sp.]
FSDAAPALGARADDLLSEIGYSSVEITDLRGRTVIGSSMAKRKGHYGRHVAATALPTVSADSD